MTTLDRLKKFGFDFKGTEGVTKKPIPCQNDFWIREHRRRELTHAMINGKEDRCLLKNSGEFTLMIYQSNALAAEDE